MELLIALAIGLGVYFLPAVVAAMRSHENEGGIMVLNLLLGWTVLGWIAALVWAVSGSSRDKPGAPTPATHVKCPDCAELIKREARVCKHCGCKLIPQ